MQTAWPKAKSVHPPPDTHNLFRPLSTFLYSEQATLPMEPDTFAGKSDLESRRTTDQLHPPIPKMSGKAVHLAHRNSHSQST